MRKQYNPLQLAEMLWDYKEELEKSNELLKQAKEAMKDVASKVEKPKRGRKKKEDESKETETE
jgi:hypothetical protein